MSQKSTFNKGEFILVTLGDDSYIEGELLSDEINETKDGTPISVYLVALTTSPKIVTYVSVEKINKMPDRNDITEWDNCVWQPEGLKKDER